MYSQQQFLSPTFNPQISHLSTRIVPDQPLNYSTSQVRPFPSVAQQQYYVTSGVSPQINNSLQGQQIGASRIGPYNQNMNINSQIHTSNLYKNIVGLREKKQSQSRITYHPYTRTYIDYEQQVILVPVEKVRINYYEKIYQTHYVPQPIEEIITETIAVEKEEIKVRYIPVEQTIFHFPKEEKKFIPAQQKERKVIYVDRPSAEVKKNVQIEVEPQHKIIQSNSSNLNTLIANFQQNLNAIESPKLEGSNSANFTPNNISSTVQNYRNIQNVSPSSSAFEQEGQKIILEQKPNQLLRQSHVKQIYKPQNEAVDF